MRPGGAGVRSTLSMRPPMDHCGPVGRSFEPFPGSALGGSIIDRFDVVVQRFSERVALSDCTDRLTYGELARLVYRIAAAVSDSVADRSGPVAIMLSRDVSFPAAMLGALASGRGFVPLDAGDPPERIRHVAAQSGAAAVISAGELASQSRSLFSNGLPVLDIHSLSDAARQPPPSCSRPDDLAFIVYTSGSTGRPKGAFHNHRNLLHDVLQQTNTLHLNADDRVALVYSPAVIAAIREIFMTLLNGASLHILPPQQLQPSGLVREIRARGITICRTVPVLLRRLAQSLGPDERLDTVRVVGMGSQRIDWGDFDVFRSHFPSDACLIVGIGATECGGNYCHWFVDEELRAKGGRLPIGRILPDASVMIADGDGCPVADGEVGEFVVASRYLALGYWRDPHLTGQVFAIDPGDPETRIFKTGDMGRMRPDGLLEYVGRRDQQIKLRGHRIEIGEIELVLGECTGVEDAAVVVRRDETGLPKSLAAYVERRPDAQELLPRDLLSILAKRLPGYMVPASLYVVEKLPRLPHLKIDRVRLAELDLATQVQLRDQTTGKLAVLTRRSKKILGSNVPALAPFWRRVKKMPAAIFGPSKVELLIDEIICIFERVIEMKGAKANDTVASAGGDSLHAVMVAAEIEQKYHLELPAEFAEERRTVGEIARWIHAHRGLLPGRANGNPAGSADLKTLATEITTSFEQRHAPDFALGDDASWIQAVNYLLSDDYLTVAEHGLRYLREQIPTSTYAKRVGDVLHRLPWEGTALPFQDDPAKDVQIVARDGAKSVIVLFCDGADRLGLRLPIMHGWFGRQDASLVYLRDFAHCNYLRGVASLGTSREATLAKLREIIALLGAKRVVCYGNSAGVFGALSYGLDLAAEAVLCMGGATNLSPEFQTRAPRQQRATELQAQLPNSELDLRPLYAKAPRAPRVHFVYGLGYAEDRRHAEHMAGLPSITLQPIDNFDEHVVVAEVIRRGEFEDLLHWLVPRGIATLSEQNQSVRFGAGSSESIAAL